VNILFLTTAHNSLSQRAYVELTDRGHKVYVEIASSEEVMIEAYKRYRPELIIAPMLKKAIPDSIWQETTCIIVHPGIKGDRGPSSLDWAIIKGAEEWGVTLLQANEEMDAGDIWASHTFPMRAASKSNLYRHEVTEAAIKGLLEVIERFADDTFTPEPLDYSKPDVKGKLQEPMRQIIRAIDWAEPTAVIARKIRSADSAPGVLHTIFNEQYYLYGAHEEDQLKGAPGTMIAQRNGAVCLATGDGAIWITHVKKKGAGDEVYCKLPAALVWKDWLADVPEVPLAVDAQPTGRTYRDIWYEEKNEVGYLHFDFYNGAMSTDQCDRLREAYVHAKQRPTKVIVLMGGHDFWSNGIHLNVIEAADDAGEESWNNINAMNDLVREIILTETHLVISAMQGNAGAGGVILALAADYVFARKGVVLNPHYKGMGNLYGSEYWTYLLPKRVGEQKAVQLTEALLPVGTRAAVEMGLIDDCFAEDAESFRHLVMEKAEEICASLDYPLLLKKKRETRKADEERKPLESYRAEELKQMRENFFGADRSYHLARKRFIYKNQVVQLQK